MKEEYKPPCIGCLQSDTLLKLALTAARGRLLNITNIEHDEIFDKISKYLKDKYPNEHGCGSLEQFNPII